MRIAVLCGVTILSVTLPLGVSGPFAQRPVNSDEGHIGWPLENVPVTDSESCRAEDTATSSPSTGVPFTAQREFSASFSYTCIPASDCCKICSKGKACGDTCIRRDYTCHVGRGCACDSDEVCSG